MALSYRPALGAATYFAADGSGVAAFCRSSGDTHFIHVDPKGLEGLLGLDRFSLNQLSEGLSLDPQSAQELAEMLVAFRMIDEID